MITASDFMAEAKRRGFDFYTGVPCSFLTPLINGVLNNHELFYVGAASEGEAVAIAAGAWLAGRRTVVLCQNSGLGNAVNPLTSLNAPFRIPTLLVTTWRGQPGFVDEPQHELMGRITLDLLSLIGVAHAQFPNKPEQLAPALSAATRHMDETAQPFAFVVGKGDVLAEEICPTLLPLPSFGRRSEWTGPGPLPTRAAVLQRFLERVESTAAVIATTGKCGRELFTLEDRQQHLYQVGSMGCATGMALGIALNTTRTVIVLDGDGAALMKLGTFATVGAYRPGNLIHILLDNGMHDSTGGQATVSGSVDFSGIALACGYQYAASCATLEGFDAAFRAASEANKPALIHVRITAGSLAKLGRPTVHPAEVARRFAGFLSRPRSA
jgi:phosphonopyruvate decarboxylase